MRWRKIGAGLARRKIDLTASAETPHIALISEWDTLYGRSLPRTFVAVAKGLAEEAAAKGKQQQRGSPFRHWRSTSMHFVRSGIRTGCIAIRIWPALTVNCRPRKTERMRGAQGQTR